MNLLLFLSDRCNMSCDYCFLTLNEGPARVLEPSAAERAVSDHLDRQPGAEAAFTILGGEPFIHYPLLERLVAVIRERAPSAPIQVVTNGTLSTVPRLEGLRKLGAQVTLSLDGTARSHDRHRRLIGSAGASSSEAILALVPAALRRELRVNMVVSEDTAASLLSNIEHLRGGGFETISFHLNVMESWSDSGLNILRKALDGFVRYCGLLDARAKAGLVDAFAANTRDRGYLGRGHAYDDVILGADGRYYPCDGLFCLPYSRIGEWNVGNAYEGVDWRKRARLHRQAADFIHEAMGGKPHLNCPREAYFRAVALGRSAEESVRASLQADGILQEACARLAA